MFDFEVANRMHKIHSDIRGPLFIEAKRMESEGQKVLKLNTGNPGIFGFTMPESIRRGLLDNYEKALPYCDLKGMPDARRAIVEYETSKGIKDLDIDDVFIGNGVSEVAQMVMNVITEVGSEILIPMPSYSLWTNLVYIAEAKPVFYKCDENANWFPDISDLKKKITKNTKAIVIINPNNPTGAIYSKEVLEEMIQIARENNLLVLSDEIYDRLCMDNMEHISTAALAPDLPVITFNGLSKSHLICGFRCGWIALSGPEKIKKSLKDEIQKLAAMRLCGNALTQLVIPYALKDPESTKKMIIPGGRLYEQREATCKALDKIPGISYVKTRAAFYMFPKVDVKKFNIKSDKQFLLDVLHGTNILFIPGSGFDWPEPDHFRIVMLAYPEEIEESFARFGKFLETYKQKN